MQTPPSKALWRDPLVWQLPLLLGVSVGYESLFIHYGLNPVDEGWPLYAAMRLFEGGTLYDDIFFVFPPGHLLSAWIAYGIDPPGVVPARVIYAAFSVALSVGIYLLGRKMMPATFALFGALLLAVGATSAHHQQLLFGYRYLVISLLALLAFSGWLRERRSRWTFLAGLLTGAALFFRLTPAFAVAVGIGVGVLLASGSWRSRIRAWSSFGGGIALLSVPVIGWFLVTVGPEKLWLEVVTRPLAMTDGQRLPVPPLTWLPLSFDRDQIADWFVAVQFRAWTLLYLGYTVGLGASWLRARWAGRPFAQPLLCACVIWGGVYFLRAFGRADSAHLYSALPPVCLLLGHLSSGIVRQLAGRVRTGPRVGRASLATVGAIFFGAWIYLGGGDRAFDPQYRGERPLAVLDGEVSLRAHSRLIAIDPKVAIIQRRTRPGDTILDLSAYSLFHVLSERLGPGYSDIIMPRTFLDGEEELRFLHRLQESPPALVIYPGQDFDKNRWRAARNSAPQVVDWVMRNYDVIGRRDRWTLMVPTNGAGTSRRGSQSR